MADPSGSTNTSNSAYPTGYQQAIADDWVYVAWVWRQSPDASTNHSLSGMKSKDLETWFNLCGEPVTLPITTQSKTVIDPVPIKGGLLNSGLTLSFDADKRPVITYQKNVEKKLSNGTVASTTQVFNARAEGSAIRIYQLTSWDSLEVFNGSGVLPGSPSAISFGGLSVSPSGVTSQAVTRSIEDTKQCASVEKSGGKCSAFPPSGNWEIQDGAAGLALRSPLTAVSPATTPASSDPFDAPPKPSLPAPAVENQPLSSKGAHWQVHMHWSRYETRWDTLRADFDGDGSGDRGVFDRYNSTFFLDVAGKPSRVRFGARDGYLWPLVGDWNHDGLATIGLYDPTAEKAYLKNTLAGGAADETLSAPVANVPGVVDSPLIWHSFNPSTRYAIKWETLPGNLDCPYDCDGVSLIVNGKCEPSRYCQDTTRMLSNLYLYEYDPATPGSWKKSLIDRAWGGAYASFDFVTFKNVQLVAYYGQGRTAKIARRVRLDGVWSDWSFSALDYQPRSPVSQGWDGHCSLTLFVDANNTVHFAGDMHASPLNYFRSVGGLGRDGVLAFVRVDMTGLNSSNAKITYPMFFRGPLGELLFQFREGGSGEGNTFLNIYDEAAMRWTPLYGSAADPLPLFKGLQ